MLTPAGTAGNQFSVIVIIKKYLQFLNKVWLYRLYLLKTQEIVPATLSFNIMNSIAALNPNGCPMVDEILRGSINLVELAFPDRIHSVYLIGSYTDGTATPNSDVDLTIIFKNNISKEEFYKLKEVAANISTFIPVNLDYTGIGEDVVRKFDVGLKLCSVHLCGEDIREEIRLISIETYTRQCMYGDTISKMAYTARRTKQLVYPIQYPDPTDKYYGYAYDRIEQKPQTKVLISVVLRITAALISFKTRQYAVPKRHAVSLYRSSIGDEWSALIEDIYHLCRTKWNSEIPTSEADQEALREICEQVLELENHFLEVHRDFVVKELNTAEERHQVFACLALQGIIYPHDAELKTLLQRAARSQNEELSEAAQKALIECQAYEKQQQQQQAG